MTDPVGSASPAGPQEGRCGAIRGRDEDGNPSRWCRKYPRRGQARCEDHGGSAPQSLAAAARRQQEAAAAKAVATFGLRRDIGAEDALLEELQWTAGHVAWLRDRVAELDPGALIWGVTSVTETQASQFPGVDTTREAAPNVWLTVYQRERAHLLAVASAILKAGVDERRVRLAERQGAQLADAGRAYIAGVIDALGLDARSAGPVMQRLFADMLRALAGGAVAVTA